MKGLIFRERPAAPEQPPVSHTCEAAAGTQSCLWCTSRQSHRGRDVAPGGGLSPKLRVQTVRHAGDKPCDVVLTGIVATGQASCGGPGSGWGSWCAVAPTREGSGDRASSGAGLGGSRWTEDSGKGVPGRGNSLGKCMVSTERSARGKQGSEAQPERQGSRPGTSGSSWVAGVCAALDFAPSRRGQSRCRPWLPGGPAAARKAYGRGQCPSCP